MTLRILGTYQTRGWFFNGCSRDKPALVTLTNAPHLIIRLYEALHPLWQSRYSLSQSAGTDCSNLHRQNSDSPSPSAEGTHRTFRECFLTELPLLHSRFHKRYHNTLPDTNR